jgi:hypothetical protein
VEKHFFFGGTGIFHVGEDGNKEVWGFKTFDSNGIATHHFGEDARNNFIDGPVIRPWEPSLMQKWEMDDRLLSNISYDIADGIYVTGQFFTPWHKPTHLDNQQVIGDEGSEAFVTTATTLLPYTKVGKVQKLTAPQFSLLFKGNLSKFSPKTRGKINKGINEQILEKPVRAVISSLKAIYAATKDLLIEEE